MRVWQGGLCLAIGTTLIAPAHGAGHAKPSKLFRDSRQTLAITRAQGRKEIVLLVAAVPGGTGAVADKASQMGGNVRYRDDEVGYLRVRMPIDRVNDFVEFDKIESVAADLDETYPNRMGTDGRLKADAGYGSELGDHNLLSAPSFATPQDQQQWPPKWSAYPLEHPYSPLKDIDAADFQTQHPTYDGRGVTIALLDGNFDLLLPEFQTAYDLNGNVVPKVADYKNMTDPRDDLETTPQWLDMHTQVTSEGGHVTYQGKTFTTPHDGAFRIGLFSERRFNNPSDGSYIEQDLDRDGNPRGDDGLFGVLWDERTNEVWVDSDRSLNFANKKAMTDYRKHYDVGVFGKDDPSTPIRESIGFVVQTDPQNKFISINCGFYQHATEIMGSVVGNKHPNGRLQGVAPGARLMSFFWGVGYAHSMVEALIAAYKDPDVDLIVVEQSVAIMSVSYTLSDAHHPFSVVAQRLINRYHKLMFVPGDNSPGFAFVAEDGQAPGAVSAGAYQSSDSYLANSGFTTEHHDNMHWGGLSHGPSGIGALKPDFISPSGQVSTDPGYRKGAFIRGLMALPPGYSIDGGTSTATPMAAGSTALVVSAAKQTHVPYEAERLKTALIYSARYVPNLMAYEQGNGLVQVAAAYELLKKLKDVELLKITSKAPVRTRISPFLQTPDQGVGIFEREGWSGGDHGTRTITFTRTNGPKEPMAFNLTWEGNDGTFSAGNAISLPLNTPVDLPVQISVSEPGPHSAILTLDNPTIPGHAYRVLSTVVGALKFMPENNYVIHTEVTVPRPGDRGVFVYVPEGASALTFTGASTASFRWDMISPSREYTYGAGTTTTIERPEAGVWELNVCMNEEARDYDPSRELPLKATVAKVTATLLGTKVTADGGAASSLSAGGSVNVPVQVSNQFAATSAAVSSSALGSAFRADRSISQGEQHIYEVTVPKGATSLMARVSGVSDSAALLDVYVMDCTAEPVAAPVPLPEKDKGNKAPPRPAPNCPTMGKAAARGGPGEVKILNPKAGRWAIVVDAYSVPTGKTSYSYVDLFTDPKLGSLTLADSAENRGAGASWSPSAHAWAAAIPASPRKLMAVVGVAGQGLPASIVLGETEVPLGQ